MADRLMPAARKPKPPKPPTSRAASRSVAKKSGKVPAMTPLKRYSSRAGSMDPARRQDTGSSYPKQNTGRYYTSASHTGKSPQDRSVWKVRSSTATSRVIGDLEDGDKLIRPRARKAAGAPKKAGRK